LKKKKKTAMKGHKSKANMIEALQRGSQDGEMKMMKEMKEMKKKQYQKIADPRYTKHFFA